MDNEVVKIIFIIVDVIVIPWSVWVTVKLFSLEQKTLLLNQEVEFLKTNLVKDVQSIKDSLESTQKSTTTALEKLNEKMDLFMSNELKLLKDMIKKP